MSIRLGTAGSAAVEFALTAPLLLFLFANAADTAFYVTQRMQVDNAAQMGVHAAWRACSLIDLPATLHCGGLADAVTTAVQGTTLGAQVALQAGYPAEGYYCVDGSGTLTYVAAADARPADCSAVGQVGVQPGDYVQVQVSYSPTSLLPGYTLTSLLPQPMVVAAWMRLG